MTTPDSDIPTARTRASASPRPAVEPKPENIPQVLRDRRQWVCWMYVLVPGKGKRPDRWTKVPMSAHNGRKASSTDPATWATLEQALQAFRRHPKWAGIGFVFSPDDEFCGIDFDDCIDADGNLVPEAAAIVAAFATYTETSPSGKGVKMICIGKKPEGAACKSKRIEGFKETEIYDTERYFALTGAHWPGTPLTVEARQTQIDDLCTRLWPAEPVRPRATIGSGSLPNTATASGAYSNLDDDALIEKAKSAANGDKFSRLWAGDAGDYGGDQSRADLALCGMLAFWANGDAAQMDRLFRRSGLMRGKWDRSSGKTSYGQRTIAKALSGKTEFYAPKRRAALNTEKSAPKLVDHTIKGPCGVVLTPIQVNVSLQRRSARFVEGQAASLSLRGVVGFCKILLRIAATMDYESSRSTYGETVFVARWRDQMKSPTRLSPDPGVSANQIVRLVNKSLRLPILRDPLALRPLLIRHQLIM